MQYRNRKEIYHGRRVDVALVDVEHPKGGFVEREIIEHPGAVVILPLLDADTVILIRNYRHVVGEVLWEVPAGTLEENEQPLTCAVRELEEETGYRANKITHLFDMYSTPGFCNEKLYVFLAEELQFVGQKLDETEQIEVEPLPLSTALEMIKSGEIHDAKTLCLLFYLQQTRSTYNH